MRQIDAFKKKYTVRGYIIYTHQVQLYYNYCSIIIRISISNMEPKKNDREEIPLPPPPRLPPRRRLYYSWRRRQY